MNLFEQMMVEHGKLPKAEDVDEREDSIDPEKSSKKTTKVLNEDDVRKYTNKLYELLEEGVLDGEWLAKSLLVWLSEDEVKEFAEYYDIMSELDDEDLDESLTESINKKVRGKLTEDLKLYTDIGDYQPWSGAVDTWDKIVEEDKVNDLEFQLEELYPEGLSVTELNDLLWFDGETVLGWLGISDIIGEHTYRVTNIVWDADEDDDIDELPSSYNVDIEVEEEDDDIEELVRDALENEFGFSASSFDFDLDESLKNKSNLKESVGSDRKVYILLNNSGVDSVFSEEPSLDIRVLNLKDITDEDYDKFLGRLNDFSGGIYLTDMPFKIVTDFNESCKNNKKLKEGKETSYKGYKIVDIREPGDMSYVDAEYLEPTCFIYKGNRCVGNAYGVTDAKHKIDQNKSWNPVLDPALPADMKLSEDTVKKSNGKWTNRGDTGEEHGEFKTKKKADAQRKAMYARGYKGESKKKVTERNLTRSERHNRNMDRIFNTKKEQDKKFADFLRKNGYSEDEIKSLEDADKLNAEIYDKFGGSKAIGDILKESSEYKTIAKLSNGLEVISYPYGYAISDGYTNDRLTVRGDTFVMDDGRFKLSNKDKEKINNLIKKKEITESIDDDSNCYTYKNYTICNDPKRGLWIVKELEGETFSTDTDAEERIDGILDESKKLKEKTYYDHNDLGTDVGEYQEWVDYDMDRYGRISVETRRKLRNAGLTLVRDQYGNYEVIADEPIHNRKNRYDKRRYDDREGL